MRRRGPARVWDRLTDKAVRFTPQISPDVVAVHLFDLDRRDDEWRAAGLNPPPLMLRATCRLIYAPPLRLVERPMRFGADAMVGVPWHPDAERVDDALIFEERWGEDAAA